MKQFSNIGTIQILWTLFCVFCLCVCSFAVSSPSNETPNYDLPVVSPSKGKPYDVFFQVGREMKSRIQKYVTGNEELFNQLLPFVQKSEENMEIYRNFVEDNKKAFPQYFEEIKGLSDGSQIPFDYIMLLNLENEILAILDESKEEAPEVETSCSDIFLSTVNRPVKSLSHNEDAYHLIKDYAYMVNASFSDDSNLSSFVAYSYPGTLIGNSFGFNEHGLIITTNAEFPKIAPKRGIARGFLNRDFYNSKTPEELINKIKNCKGLAAGFAVNIVSTKTGEMYNVEVSMDQYFVKKIYDGEPAYGHFNQYRNLKVDEHLDPSSIHRLARFNQFKPPTTKEEVLVILGDTEDKEYPIYRDGFVSTTATAHFDVSNKTAFVYLENPKQNPNPVRTFRLP